jgi:hypothetical protein
MNNDLGMRTAPLLSDSQWLLLALFCLVLAVIGWLIQYRQKTTAVATVRQQRLALGQQCYLVRLEIGTEVYRIYQSGTAMVVLDPATALPATHAAADLATASQLKEQPYVSS